MRLRQLCPPHCSLFLSVLISPSICHPQSRLTLLFVPVSLSRSYKFNADTLDVRSHTLSFCLLSSRNCSEISSFSPKSQISNCCISDAKEDQRPPENARRGQRRIGRRNRLEGDKTRPRWQGRPPWLSLVSLPRNLLTFRLIPADLTLVVWACVIG